MNPIHPLFETQSLGKDYGGSVRAVMDVTLAVERGAVLVVTGPSGSGKTTLLALLGALERPTSGRILFDGTDLTQCSGPELARTRRRIGFVFQDFALIPSLTALENVTYPLIPRRVPAGERQRRAEEFLSRFGLAGKLAVRAGHLSGGEQQRVAIARAFAGDPDALLADEPTSNLDSVTADLFLESLHEFRSAGKTAIVASHDPRVLELASVRCELVSGKLIAGK